MSRPHTSTYKEGSLYVEYAGVNPIPIYQTIYLSIRAHLLAHAEGGDGPHRGLPKHTHELRSRSTSLDLSLFLSLLYRTYTYISFHPSICLSTSAHLPSHAEFILSLTAGSRGINTRLDLDRSLSLSSVPIYIYLSIDLSIYLSNDLSAHIYAYLYIYTYIYLSICLSVYLSIYRSIDRSICLSVYLSIDLSARTCRLMLKEKMNVMAGSRGISTRLELDLYIYLLSTYRLINLSIYRSICLSVYPALQEVTATSSGTHTRWWEEQTFSLALSGAPDCGVRRLPEGSRRDTGGGLRDDQRAPAISC